MADVKTQQLHGTDSQRLEAAQAARAGSKYEWHYGRITRLGNYEVGDGRGVSILWEERGVSSQQGDIADEQWEILKLAFMTSGRIAILSDLEGDQWMYDLRFLEAVR